MDDVVVYSETWESHLSDLKRVIQCLSDSGFTIKRRKCCFGRRHLTYLGHRIGGGGLSIPQCRVDSLVNFRKPITKRDMRSFLGAMSYYRRFIPGFGQFSSSLTPSVSLRAPLQVEWTSGMDDAFSKLKFCWLTMLFCVSLDGKMRWLFILMLSAMASEPVSI